MIELVQNEDFLIGSPDAIAALEVKRAARVLVLSDSHGGYKILERIVRRFGPGCDALVFCGDGAADLACLLTNAASSPELKAVIPPVLAFVRGNNDSSSYPLSFELRPQGNRDAPNFFIPMTQQLCVNHHRLFIAHGHKFSVYYDTSILDFEAEERSCTVAVYGHTHIPLDGNGKWAKLVNPGSISLPRGGYPPSFAILTAENAFVDAAFLEIVNAYSDNADFRLFRV